MEEKKKSALTGVNKGKTMWLWNIRNPKASVQNVPLSWPVWFSGRLLFILVKKNTEQEQSLHILHI